MRFFEACVCDRGSDLREGFEGTALQLPGVAFKAILTWISD